MTDTLIGPVPPPSLPLLASELKTGDHLDQPTFHARYLRTPPGFRAELIGGMVILPSPLGLAHSQLHNDVVDWLNEYRRATPGTDVLLTPSVILAEDSEPQPDAALIVVPERGGQTSVQRPNPGGEEYVSGPPELIVEVASSSVAYDLHSKMNDYQKAGVAEYLVILVKERTVRWFRQEQGRFIDVMAAADGTLRSRVFPGLWLEAAALVARNHRKLSESLQRGISSLEHAAFVQQLESRKSSID